MKKPPPQVACQLLELKRKMGISDMPLDEFIIQVAKEKGEKLEIDYVNFKNGDGLLKQENNIWHLACNSKFSIGRRHFTVAHEFGHYLLHSSKQKKFNCSEKGMYGNNDETEKEADKFASYFLIPRDTLKTKVDELDISFNNFRIWKEEYSVSLTAFILAWLDITQKRACIIISVDGFILWSRSSRKAWKSGLYYKSASQIPEKSLINLNNQSQILLPLEKGIWSKKEEVSEMSFYNELYDRWITVLVFEDEDIDYGEEKEEDSFDYITKHIK